MNAELKRRLPPDWREVPGGYRVGAPNGRPPWVLIPGIRGDPWEFSRLTPWLDGLVHVTDTGRAEGSPPPRTLSEYASTIAASLPEGPLRVVGASFGGLVGLALPPSRVASLVTIGSLPAPTRASRQAGVLGHLVPLLPLPLYTRLYGRRTAHALTADGPDLGALQVPPPARLAARLRAIGRWGLPNPEGRGIVSVWGQHDDQVSWTERDVRARGITPSRVPGGHFPHLSHPEAIAALLLDLPR